MHFQRRHLTQHRFQRIILWALAMLTWIAAMLSGNRAVSARHKHQRFDISLPWLARLVGQLIIVRAAELVRRRRPTHIRYWRRGRNMCWPHIFRSILGARLRRALGHKDVRVRIANLIAMLRDLDAYAGSLARRLRCGLTRVWRTWSPISHAPLLFGAPAPTPALSDSS